MDVPDCKARLREESFTVSRESLWFLWHSLQDLCLEGRSSIWPVEKRDGLAHGSTAAVWGGIRCSLSRLCMFKGIDLCAEADHFRSEYYQNLIPCNLSVDVSNMESMRCLGGYSRYQWIYQHLCRTNEMPLCNIERLPFWQPAALSVRYFCLHPE